jgi:hypothetical protein
MRPLTLLLLPLCAALALPATGWAQDRMKDPKKKGAKVELPSLDLGLGSMGADIPKADGLHKPEERNQNIGPQVTSENVKYEVVKVEHAKDFIRTASGAKATPAPLKAVVLSGNPPTLQAFTTLIRVRASQKLNTSIDLVILDPRGDTALTGSGQLVFSKGESQEMDYLLDWAPVARPLAGEYQLLVRIGGQPMGTWPLSVTRK